MFKFWIFPQLIKKKIPTCATVKYRIQTGRWKGKKQNSKSNLKKEKIKSNENLNAEESKSAKDDDSKLEKCDETKSEKHEETQSENGKEKQKEREEKSCTDWLNLIVSFFRISWAYLEWFV